MGAKTGPMAMVGYFWDSAPFYPIVAYKSKNKGNWGTHIASNYIPMQIYGYQ